MYKRQGMLFKGTELTGTGRLNELSLRLWSPFSSYFFFYCQFSCYYTLHLFCSVSTPPVTFEDGADVFPDGDAAAAVELPESQLHIEERDTSKHRHQQVGEQKGT